MSDHDKDTREAAPANTSTNAEHDKAEAEHPPPQEGPPANSKDEQPAKRSRGRPKGSKNKPRDGAASSAPATEAGKRKRGRPPKERPAESMGEAGDEQPAKRPRGRPPKKPVQSAGEEDADGDPASAGTSAAAKKRGRPPKSN